jgi:hypothetical protein
VSRDPGFWYRAEAQTSPWALGAILLARGMLSTGLRCCAKGEKQNQSDDPARQMFSSLCGDTFNKPIRSNSGAT